MLACHHSRCSKISYKHECILGDELKRFNALQLNYSFFILSDYTLKLLKYFKALVHTVLQHLQHCSISTILHYLFE